MNNIETQDRVLFENIAKAYSAKDIARSSSAARRYQSMNAVMPLPARATLGKVVEFACGIGATAEYMKGHYKEYIGIDYSSEMIDIARWYNRNNSNTTFSVANVKDYKVSGGAADTIFISGALHHMQDLDQVFVSVKAAAKPGAQFVALEPFGGNPLIGALRFLRMKVDKSYSDQQIFFSKKQLYDLLSKHNMQDIEIVNQGYFTPPFAQVIFPLQPIASIFSKIAIFLDKILDRHFSGLFGPLSWNLVIRAKFP